VRSRWSRQQNAAGDLHLQRRRQTDFGGRQPQPDANGRYSHREHGRAEQGKANRWCGLGGKRSTSPTRGGVTWREALWSTAMPLDLIEFPADDLARARRFWETLLDVSLDERREGEGQGLQTHEVRGRVSAARRVDSTVRPTTFRCGMRTVRRLRQASSRPTRSSRAT
jgi:hypothetical protein